MEPKLISLQCPSCGAPLQAENDTTYTCPFCQHKVKVQRVEPVIHQTVNHYHSAPYTPARPTPQQTSDRDKVFGILVAGAAGIMLLFFLGLLLNQGGTGSTGPVPVNNTGLAADEYMEEDAEEAPPSPARQLPESKPMQQFLTEALGKDFSLVTAEDIAAFRYLTFYNGAPMGEFENKSWTFTYSFADYDPTTGEGAEHFATIKIPGDETVDALDIACFTGLTYLDVGNSNIDGRKDLQFTAMPNLQYMYTRHPRALDAEIYADPANIRAIKLNLGSESLTEGLADFTNLTHLYLDDVDSGFTDFAQLAAAGSLTHLYIDTKLADISWISQHTGLTHLEVECREVTDFSVLYGLPKLESLKLNNAGELRDIGFAASMPNLHALYIKNSEIHTLEPLTGMASLYDLHIESSYSLQDYGPVSTLTNLQSFYMSYNSNVVNLDLNNLAFLETVSLHAHYISAVAGNPNVKSLTLFTPAADNNLDVFWNMTGLETLRFQGSNDYDFGLTSLASLPNLKHLSMTDFFVMDGFDPFSWPGLETLTLKECQLPLNMGTPATNSSLTSLTIINCRYYDLAWNKYEVPAGLQDILAACTKLERLTINGAALDNIAFAESLTELRHLDITDNYISDLAPLAGLTNLETLICAKNSINTYDMLPDGVAVTS